MSILFRLKSAARILLRGGPGGQRRGPIPEITASEVAEMKRFFRRDKFFMMGHARSGTTLLMRLVRLHPEVHANYQAHFFTRKPLLKSLVESPEIQEWLSRKSNRWNHGRDLSPVVLRAVAEYVMEREADALGKRIVGDKSPSSNIHGQAVRDLHAVFPEARIVCVVRDGRDVLISERFRNFVEESRYLQAPDRRILRDLRQHPELFGPSGRSIFTDGMIRRLGSGWSRNTRETEIEGKRLYGRRFMVLRYEDLLEDPYDEMVRVWRFLGVTRVGKALRSLLAAEMKSNPDEEWQAKRGEELASFLPKGRSGNWRDVFTTLDKGIFKEVAADALIKWNYEESSDW